MREYRCYFLTREGRIDTRMEFRARDDLEGLEFARELYVLHADAIGTPCGFELWQQRRLVCREEGSPGCAELVESKI